MSEVFVAMNGSSLISADTEGLKELSTQAFVGAYGKHVRTNASLRI